jgi:D-amino peptidase
METGWHALSGCRPEQPQHQRRTTMRVALIFDMEGTAHVGHPREVLPMYREYWATGRAKLTDDVVAAAEGLLAGGASEVLVMNHHGAGDVEWPNVMTERFPDRVHLPDDFGKRGLRDRVDAMFQVGVHARGGSRSFLSHTLSPGLRFRLNGELLSESHWWAFTGAVPLLGMVGSEALEAERGSLGDVPFLAVQRSRDRATAEPVFATPRATADAIRSFAELAMRNAGQRRSRTPAGPIRLEASLPNAEDAASGLAEAGWQRTSATEFAIEAPGWRGDPETIDDAIWAASEAVWLPYAFWFADLDATSEETALAFPAERLERSDAMLSAWAADQPPEWFDPEMAGRLEGFAVASA